MAGREYSGTNGRAQGRARDGGQPRQRPRSGTRQGGTAASRRPASSRGARNARLRRGLAAKRASGAARVLGLSTTRRAAILAIACCALAFTVAVPLRTYLTQQSELTVQQKRQDELQAKRRELRERKGELQDPAVIEAEARSRLGYVMPGQTPYVVQLPEETASQRDNADDEGGRQPDPWYETLWQTVNDDGSG